MGIFLDIAKVLANLDNVSEFVAEKGFSEALRAKTVKDLIDELNGLSSVKIAEFLSDMGYNGEVGDTEHNPVVAYIKDSFPEVDNVWADWEEGYYGYTNGGGFIAQELLPYNVSQFLENYSEGLYEDLFEDEQDLMESELEAWDEGSEDEWKEWDDFDDEDLEDESDDESDEFEDEDLDIDESDDDYEDEPDDSYDDEDYDSDDEDLDEDDDSIDEDDSDDLDLNIPSKDEYSQQEADNAWKRVSGLFRKYLK